MIFLFVYDLLKRNHPAHFLLKDAPLVSAKVVSANSGIFKIPGVKYKILLSGDYNIIGELYEVNESIMEDIETFFALEGVPIIRKEITVTSDYASTIPAFCYTLNQGILERSLATEIAYTSDQIAL